MKWLREFYVSVGGKVFPYQGFEMEFSVDFDDTEDPDQAKVKIYNLTPETETSMEVGDDFVLEAGFQGNTGVLLEGEVTDIHTEADGTERVCEIEAVDSSKECLNKQVCKSWEPGATSEEVLNDVLGESGLEIADMRLEEVVEYKRGYHVDGKVREIIKDVCVNDSKSKCHIIHGAAYCNAWPDISRNSGVVWNQDTGLIGIPSRISGDHTVRTFEAVGLLEHILRAGMDIAVQSETANGSFQIKKGTHRCTRNEYTTTLEIIDASPSGAQPSGEPIKQDGGDKNRLPDPSDWYAPSDPPSRGPGGSGGGAR